MLNTYVSGPVTGAAGFGRIAAFSIGNVPVPQAAPEVMAMLQMTCPSCGKKLELDDARRGRPTRCPHCGGAFRAPLDDDGPATGARREGRTGADALALAATLVAVTGCLMTGAGLLVRLAGGTLPVGMAVLRWSVIVPIAAIAVSWLVARKARSPRFVLASRFAAYLWILGLLILMLRLL